MAVDVNKQLDRAKRFLEKNRLEDAIEAYQSVLSEVPSHLESIQALGDSYIRLGQSDRAAFYYALLFDRLYDMREENKALAIYSRALKGIQQPAERMARYALLLQRQNRAEEAIEQYTLASELLLAHGQQEAGLDCLEHLAQLDPDNPSRQSSLAALAEQLGKTPVAARAFLRAGQLADAAGETEAALEMLGRAHELSPGERSPALLYAQALMRRGDFAPATEVLEPFSNGEMDATFLKTFGDALMHSGALDRAANVLLRLPPEQPGAAAKLFDLASCYLAAGQDAPCVALLRRVQKPMIASRQESDFSTRLDALVGGYPASVPLVEFQAAAYAELSREAKYFDALVRLFDLYLQADNVVGACDALEKLVEIDPYDAHNHERIERVRGRADASFLARIQTRFSQVATHASQTAAFLEPSSTPSAEKEAAGSPPGLEDLLVQAEIFVQYSLQAKAIERLQTIVQMFPGEHQRNERMRHLCQLVNWWPEGASPERAKTPAAEPARDTRQDSADTMRDLAKISEISQSLFRLTSPRAVLAGAVNEIGKHLKATRCLAVIGAPGKPPQMAAEFRAPGVEPAASAPLVRLLAQMENAVPDALGGMLLEGAVTPVLGELGLEAVLGVALTDRETRSQAGMVIVGSAAPHVWRLHETYFLQAIGDQMLLGVNHFRQRNLARGAADEKTGLLTRSAYQDCLLNETQNAKSKGTALSLALVQIDHGAELMRQQGEPQMERLQEQLARTLESMARQCDLAVKYTAWTIAFILPDTPLAGARALAEKLCKAGAEIRPPWDGAALTLSASVAEAVVRMDYEGEDIVTELINRVDSGLEEAEKQGGAIVSPATPAV